ncbi:unnamed protein product [Mycena citricolor]|uniref:SH3 domain-containing protein n=1 Tax=Mycena citricolor TaxID=2018698 RepID=A0AAD2JVW7_9AGAR|nr:unnamed protein product [Mycena citricolor]CAK5280745.1 unnamed protein product [Mycena citricolor]
MPPRGNTGLDFTPILTHYVFLLTTILAIVAWFIAFIGQAVSTAAHGNGSVGVLWFAIWLQLALILGVIYTLAADSIAMHRFQISTFGAVAIVFSVQGVNQGIFTGVGSLDAMAAGWLILAMVNIVWVLYFTSEEDSLTLHIFNLMGTGGLTPPSRRRRTRQPSMNDGNGYSNNYASGGGIGSHDMGMGYDAKMGSAIGSGMGMGSQADRVGVRSQNSYGGSEPGMGTRSLGTGGAGSVSNLGQGGPGSVGGGDNSASSPLMNSGGAIAAPVADPGASNSAGDAAGGSYLYKAKALYAYTASSDDPNEISFNKGDIMDILDKQGKWWQAKKADGSIGIAPSNYLQII